MSVIRRVLLLAFIKFILVNCNVSEFHELCDFFETMNISSGHQENGSFIAEDGTVFPQHTFQLYDFVIVNSTKVKVAPHVRGCLCEVKICIPLCCPLGKIRDLKSGKCIDHTDLALVVNTTDSLAVKLDDPNYAYILRKPCPYIVRFEAETYTDDQWKFTKNGTILIGGEDDAVEYDLGEYCISNILLEDSLIVTSAYTCFDEVEGDFRLAVYSTCMLISAVFLVITLLIYILLPELRDAKGKILICYITALTISFIFLPMIQLGLVHSYSKLCTIVGYLFHVFILISFFWLNVMAFDMWYSSVYHFKCTNEKAEMKRLIKYAIYAYSCPIFIACFAIFMEVFAISDTLRPRIGYETCFLASDWLPKLIYFHGPIMLILCANIFFFSHSAIYIHRHFAAAKTDEGEPLDESSREKERFSVYLKLFITMGLLWLMESISWIFEKENEKNYTFFVTDVLNCLQGVFIFIIFVCKKSVLMKTKDKIYKLIDKIRF